MPSVTFTEKLARLTERRNKAELARKVGLKATAFSDYVRQGYAPRADIALKMARALEVGLEWLVDDDQDWPPPAASKPNDLRNVSDDDLMMEAARRYRLSVLKIRRQIETLEGLDWAEMARTLYESPLNEPLDGEAILVLDLMWRTTTAFSFAPAFDTRVYADQNHQAMPGSELKPHELTLEKLQERMLTSLGSNPYFRLAEEYLYLRRLPEQSEPARREGLERLKLLDKKSSGKSKT